ncbi:MarR family winged helix-turn-helix transcriptional regulator [Aurantiacibacter sp. MUD61]|uniref:MarR family winged helix-turn-helix transcriptional regulator n=1 Tax=Aurantiacibacter sp. MUD61 TaxID=3009083 RepID=UPI0022F0E5B2|nr:MarR family winged helix-turn-helix transcriptional regulator [Aurantiacibacter sp. MUD61]
MNDLVATRQSILDGLAENWSPAQIRELASSLLRLADSIDQDWTGSQPGSVFQWPNSINRIERNAINLAQKAKVIYRKREMRKKHIFPQLLGEPAWDMLLELFMQYAGGAKVSTTSLGHASHVPITTALRHISLLEDAGMIERSASEVDKRVTFVSLTEKGVVSVGRYLEDY